MQNVPSAILCGQADHRHHSAVCMCALCSPHKTQNLPSDMLTTVPLMTGWDNFRFCFDSWYFKIVCHSKYDFVGGPGEGWGGRLQPHFPASLCTLSPLSEGASRTIVHLPLLCLPGDSAFFRQNRCWCLETRHTIQDLHRVGKILRDKAD